MAATFAFFLAFSSPLGQRWQKSQFDPTEQPFGFQYQAQGLHLPTGCIVDPIDMEGTMTPLNSATGGGGGHAAVETLLTTATAGALAVRLPVAAVPRLVGEPSRALAVRLPVATLPRLVGEPSIALAVRLVVPTLPLASPALGIAGACVGGAIITGWPCTGI